MTTPVPTVWPTLRARDARALIDFLVSAFGFEEVVAYTADDGAIHHAELAWPEGGGVMLGQERDDPDNPWTLPPGSFGAYVVTSAPDAVHKRAAAAGAEILKEPYDTDYGSRDFAARDPEGNLWSFGTYPGHGR
ncbi:VOC family protein [Cryptosporangium sp. NPDC048952]|uniref:VOC family protein n=1 Tax=Cryptosporangium sp. NPDC048952 TaxID=3363961 RepID=UPI003723509F